MWSRRKPSHLLLATNAFLVLTLWRTHAKYIVSPKSAIEDLVRSNPMEWNDLAWRIIGLRAMVLEYLPLGSKHDGEYPVGGQSWDLLRSKIVPGIEACYEILTSMEKETQSPEGSLDFLKAYEFQSIDDGKKFLEELENKLMEIPADLEAVVENTRFVNEKDPTTLASWLLAVDLSAGKEDVTWETDLPALIVTLLQGQEYNLIWTSENLRRRILQKSMTRALHPHEVGVKDAMKELSKMASSYQIRLNEIVRNIDSITKTKTWEELYRSVGIELRPPSVDSESLDATFVDDVSIIPDERSEVKTIPKF
ncbi:hypothetical protein ABW19_dt0204447 [Dactylella cylindrospora]|nr:hypothetical protein ABW19_dt0204447 [Dactylella cylindrospora]